MPKEGVTINQQEMSASHFQFDEIEVKYWPDSSELIGTEVVFELGLEAIGSYLITGTNGSNSFRRATSLTNATGAQPS